MVLGDIVQFSFNVLFRASIYALVAIGFSIIFGSLHYVNMAHGALYLLGAYVGLFIAYTHSDVGGVLASFAPLGLDWGFGVALILTPLAVAVLGVTVLAITHDIDAAFRIGDRISMLYQGRILASGRPEEMRAHADPVVQQFLSGAPHGPITP